MHPIRILLVAVLFTLCAALPARALDPGGDTPQVPCQGRAANPPFASAAEDPVPQTWTELDWQPPACLGWSDARYRLVIAMAGRFEAADATELVRRLGAISALRGLQYWSVTENASRVLIRDATALSGPEGAKRNDFAVDEVRPGAVLHFVEEDNRSSEPITYRMRVLEADNDRIAIETENVTPIRANFLTLFPSGSLRAAYLLSRLEGRTWGLYAVSASTAQASTLVKLARDSYANRARAIYGHFAGIAAPPSDRAP